LKLSKQEAFLFPKLKSVAKRKVHPFVLLGGSLIVVLLMTVLSCLWHYSYELNSRAFSSNPTPGSKSVSDVSNVAISTAPQPGNTTNATAVAPKPKSQSAQHVLASATPPDVKPSSVEVSLSINDVYKGEVSLAATGTQCDVLQKALEAGVITSLDMRYSAQYKTYAIYVINGQGDPGAIWWTYSVNGKSPPYGCSKTKVAQGDSVNWKYVKQ